jgi:hypothetical protein
VRAVGAALERGLPFSIALDARGRAAELSYGGLEGTDIEMIFGRITRDSLLPPP